MQNNRSRHYLPGVFAAIIFIYCTSVLQAGSVSVRKTTFINKSAFRSAVFIENKGLVRNQTGEKILYTVNHGHIDAFFSPNGIFYKVSTVDKEKVKERKEEREKEKGKEEANEELNIPLLTNTVRMEWLDANPNPEIEPGAKAQGYYTYLEKDKTGYKTLTAHGYNTITYKNLYPGVDVVYSLPETGLPEGWQSGMKYNLIIHPGADISKIKMKYSGKEIKSLQKDEQGNIIVETSCGNIIEKAPVSFYGSNEPVKSQFDVSGHNIGFSFPDGYASNKTLTIDPWVDQLASLPPTDQGFDVDYDYTGNTFVYGAGATGVYDYTNYFEVAKYDATGNLLWQFNGSVPAIGWSSLGGTIGGQFNLASNFKVDKNTGKVYVGKAFDPNGTTTIRLTSAGQYDDFVSNIDPNFLETWDFAYNCSSGQLLALGGGTISNLNMGVINTTTEATTTSNFTEIAAPYAQDVVSNAYDTSGNLYVIMTSLSYSLPYYNTIYKVSNTYNAYTWEANSNFSTFVEASNDPFWDANDVYNSNEYNALAANGFYLFYYDGYNIAAYNLNNGASAGNANTVAGNTALYQGGIAVDNCNHVYAGGNGVIKTFTFDGNNFNPGPDIPLGNNFVGDNVHDIKYNATTNLLYVTGDYFVGVFAASLSGACTTPNSFSISTSHLCDTAIVQVNPAPGLSPFQFTYIWSDTLGNVIGQTINSGDTSNSIPVSYGVYVVQVEWNSNCGGYALYDTVTIPLSTLSISTSGTPGSGDNGIADTTICAGQPVVLSARGNDSTGTYLWQPGGQTTSSISVAPDTTTNYTITYTPPNCPPLTGNIKVTVHPAPNVTVNNDTICLGSAGTLTATPSYPGGTYHWSVGGITTQSITVSPNSTTTYSVTYTSTCGVDSAKGTITITPAPTLGTTNDTICEGGTAQLSATPSVSGGTYLWSPGNYTTSTISVSPSTTSTYTVTYSSPGCLSTTAMATAAITPPPTLSTTNPGICAGNSTLISATPSVGGGTYTWSPGGETTSSITVSPSSTSTYTVTYNLSGCVPATDTAVVTVTSKPTVTSSGATICGGDTATLAAIPNPGGGTFQWLPGNYTTAAISVSPPITTNYIVTYSIPGCTASDTVTVIVNPQPVITLTVVNANCNEQNGSITAAASGATGPYSYFWSNLLDESTPIDSGLAQGTYTVRVFDQNECSATASASVSQSSAVSVVPSPSSFPCAQPPYANVSLTASGGVLPYTYEIQGIDTNTTGLFNNVPPGVYNYKVVDSTGCSSGGSITVVIHYNPDLFDIIADSTNCYGLDNGSVMVMPVDTPNPEYTYSLNGGAPQNGTVFDSLGAGNYQVVVYNGAGCNDTLNTTIYQPAPVTVTFPPPDTFFVTNNDTVPLNPIIANFVNPIYAWTPTSGLNCSNCASVTATIYEPTVVPPIVYYVRVSDSLNLNCTAYDSVIIIIKGQFAMPDAFTPGTGGKNSLFGPVTYSYLTVQEFHIFNRWGQLVHNSTEYWDGNYRGKEQPPGTYVYYIVVQYPNPANPDMTITGKKEGSVVLLR